MNDTRVADIRLKTVPEHFVPFFGHHPLRMEAVHCVELILCERARAPQVFAEMVRQLKRNDVVAAEVRRLWAFGQRRLQAAVASFLAVLCSAHDAQIDLLLAEQRIVCLRRSGFCY